MDYEKTGIFIANKRKELDMTQKQLAEKLKISDTCYGSDVNSCAKQNKKANS